MATTDLDQRAKAHSRSPRLLEPPLEEQREKLDTIRLHLSRAEKAEREGLWTAVCEDRLHLGLYFARHKDFWLSLHFYHSCIDREYGGKSKYATIARLHLAVLYRQQGNLEEARNHAEMGLRQAEEGGWLDPDGRPLRLWACRELGEIYSLLGESFLAARDYDVARRLLQQGSEMASEGDDKSVQGEAVFRQGLGLQVTGDHQAAKEIFSTCIEIFSSLQDVEGLVKTYKAIAKCLESEGKIEECPEQLEKAAELCLSSGLQRRQMEVCLCLGSIYTNMNEPEKACTYFLYGYKAACNAGDVTQLQKAQVKLGCTAAHPLIRKYTSDIQLPGSCEMTEDPTEEQETPGLPADEHSAASC
ncbi:tetratricopeptide repeat protein 29 isoform 2-T2 [Anableps anableps]